MANCECLEGCPFFNNTMANMPATALTFKKRYCQGDFLDCARHMVFRNLGNDKVPGDLFPNQVERAKEIISQ